MVNNGGMEFRGSNIEYTPAIGMLMAGSFFASGVPLPVLEYFPIAGGFAAFIVFILARRLLGDPIPALLVVNVLAYRFYSQLLYSFWPHSFGYTLFLMFVFLFFRYSGSRSVSLALCLSLVFVGTHVYSYNGELWIVAFLILAEAGRLVMRRLRRASGRPQGSWRSASSLLGATLITLVGLNQAIYGVYLPRFSAMQSEWTITFSYYLSMVFRTVPPVKYAWVPAPAPTILLLSNVSWFALAFAPIFVGLTVATVARTRLSRTTFSISTPKSILLGALVLVWLADLLAYIPLGAASVAATRYLTLIAAFVSPLGLVFLFSCNTRTRKIPPLHTISAYLVVLAVLSVSVFGLTFAGGYWVTSVTHYSDAEGGAEWLLGSSPNSSSILSDHHTQGEYAIVFAQAGKRFASANLYSSQSFSELVNPSLPVTSGGYFHHSFIVVNLELADKVTKAGGWLDFEPLSTHLADVNNNPQVEKVYDDGSEWIFSGF